LLQFTGEGDLSDLDQSPTRETSASTNRGTVLRNMLDETDGDEVLVEAIIRNADTDQ